MSRNAQAVLRLATRSSEQATAQARAVADSIEARHSGVRAELVFVDTVGDRRQDVPLHQIGGQGVFIKEVQRAVLDGRADVAVHSAKDLPSSPTEGLVIAAFCTRRNAADALVGLPLNRLARGATVATGSVRRQAQIRAARPDLEFVELRGNIRTRLGKIPPDGSIVMAVAALEILGLTEAVAEVLDPTEFVPAVGQGAVAVECRADDRHTTRLLAAVDDTTTREAVETERAFLATLGSGCTMPVGAHVIGDSLHAFLAAPEVGRVLRRRVAVGSGGPEVARELAAQMAADLAASGA